MGFFVIAWLGGWAFGEVSAVKQLLRGPPPGAAAFLVFWLCAWTLGGAYAVWIVRRIFQRPVPETLLVNAAGVTVDSGIPPLEIWTVQWFTRNSSQWKENTFPKRIVDTLPPRQLASLRLRETGEGNRLTVDAGARRIEFAKAATDVEREWLFNVLTEKFRLKAETSTA